MECNDLTNITILPAPFPNYLMDVNYKEFIYILSKLKDQNSTLATLIVSNCLTARFNCRIKSLLMDIVLYLGRADIATVLFRYHEVFLMQIFAKSIFIVSLSSLIADC